MQANDEQPLEALAEELKDLDWETMLQDLPTDDVQCEGDKENKGGGGGGYAVGQEVAALIPRLSINKRTGKPLVKPERFRCTVINRFEECDRTYYTVRALGQSSYDVVWDRWGRIKKQMPPPRVRGPRVRGPRR